MRRARVLLLALPPAAEAGMKFDETTPNLSALPPPSRPTPALLSSAPLRPRVVIGANRFRGCRREETPPADHADAGGGIPRLAAPAVSAANDPHQRFAYRARDCGGGGARAASPVGWGAVRRRARPRGGRGPGVPAHADRHRHSSLRRRRRSHAGLRARCKRAGLLAFCRLAACSEGHRRLALRIAQPVAGARLLAMGDHVRSCYRAHRRDRRVAAAVRAVSGHRRRGAGRNRAQRDRRYQGTGAAAARDLFPRVAALVRRRHGRCHSAWAGVGTAGSAPAIVALVVAASRKRRSFRSRRSSRRTRSCSLPRISNTPRTKVWNSMEQKA